MPMQTPKKLLTLLTTEGFQHKGAITGRFASPKPSTLGASDAASPAIPAGISVRISPHLPEAMEKGPAPDMQEGAEG